MKTFCLILSVLAFVVFTGAATANADLVSLYTFDSTLDNAVSAAPDGTMTSGSASYVSGKVGNAISLDGTQAVDTTASGYPGPSGGLLYGAVSYWIKPNASVANKISGFSSTGTAALQNYFDSGSGPKWWLKGDNGNRFVIETNTAVETGNWYLCTYAFDVSAGTAEAYVNGADHKWQITKDNTGPDAFSNVYTTGIGGYPTGVGAWSYYQNALIDDFAAWDAPLSVGKIASLYNLSTDTLNYGVEKANALFQIFDGGPGSSGTVGGELWAYASGLTGTNGQVLNSNTVVLDATAGTGVQIVPEPGTLALLATGLLGLLCYAWRKRK